MASTRLLAAILAADVAGCSRCERGGEHSRTPRLVWRRDPDGPTLGFSQEKAMPGSPIDDPILKSFRAALAELYGDRLERVVLFGSRARGCRRGFRLGLAVFIKDLGLFWSKVDRLVDLETELLYDTGAVINSMPYRVGAYQDRTSPMREIRHEGIDLGGPRQASSFKCIADEDDADNQPPAPKYLDEGDNYPIVST